VTYLQNWLVNFYPERPDLVSEAEQLAADLGGKLVVPRLSWKYSWIQKCFSRNLAKRAQVLVPRIKWSLVRRLDKTLFRMGSAAK
jgi:hypothetical protein